MDTERSAVINIGGVDYELVLTTRATKEIAGRYGGLENLGDTERTSRSWNTTATKSACKQLRSVLHMVGHAKRHWELLGCDTECLLEILYLGGWLPCRLDYFH